MSVPALTLYPSEKRYLIDVGLGLTAVQSATKRGVSVHTVNSALKTLRGVFGVSSTARVLVLCLIDGSITLNDIREEANHDLLQQG